MKIVFRLVAFSMLLISCFAFGFYWRELRSGQLPGQRKNLLAGIKTPAGNVPADQVFKQTYSRIRTNFIKDIKPEDLKYSAMEGLVASLGDPHSNFFVPKINTAFRDETRGRFYGIGARLLPDPLGVKVTSVFNDGPAKAAGIKAEDIIIAVNGVNVGGKESDDIVTMIKGEEGTPVKIRVLRKASNEPLDFTMKRAKVVPPTVESKYLAEPKVGYIKLLQFSLETTEQFDKELNILESNGPLKGLVIDLRDNPGGALEAAVEILSRFFEEKEVVSLKYRGGQTEVTNALTGYKHNFAYPIVVLQNEESASAAEIMAGVLQDYGIAKIVGEHSYGKFTVQTIFSQRDGAGLKLTIARYYLPKSGSHSRVLDDDGQFVSGGLKPDVEVELDPDAEFENGNPAKDAQLKRAIEVLQGK